MNLIRICLYTQPELIKQLWQNMIRRGKISMLLVNSSQFDSATALIPMVYVVTTAFAARQWNEQWAHYFASVGRQYVDVDFMFPLPTIIDTLETLNAKYARAPLAVTLTPWELMRIRFVTLELYRFFITYRMTPRVNDPRTALPVDTLLQMGVPVCSPGRER